MLSVLLICIFCAFVVSGTHFLSKLFVGFTDVVPKFVVSSLFVVFVESVKAIFQHRLLVFLHAAVGLILMSL